MQPDGSLESRDLDGTTWKDFEAFFSKYNGVQAGCWCMYYHRTGGTPGSTRQERIDRNHSDIHDLVISGGNRSVLVYSNGKVIASAQYGTSEELPRTGNGRNYKSLDLPEPQNMLLWRITCFFVDKESRRRGIAKFALGEVLKRIAQQGGGIVEAYPVINFRTVSVWFGSVSMFKEKGFEIVAPLGRSAMLMRKQI